MSNAIPVVTHYTTKYFRKVENFCKFLISILEVGEEPAQSARYPTSGWLGGPSSGSGDAGNLTPDILFAVN